MAETSSLLSPREKHTKPTSSIFANPRLFTSFTSKSVSETDAVMSPTSILETKPFLGLRNPFWSESNTPRTPEPESRRIHWDKLDSKGIGLAIVDALNESDPKPSNPKTRMVIFGSQLKIQIPPLQPPGRKSNGSSYLSESFLSFCDNCKKNLGQGKDIFMYRGEKAFCSRECRYQEMLLEEGADRLAA
ncbi:hypothetical protein C1H46_025329 [Malus baccata]|uniref:FLZ-type domain-containing protein n=1 Tax=Malus baccata TaxID=106549 RepID=A0A540LS55_MALBA|nr:hypothetical protein C1H46_025329 [Malus baccata]